MTSIVITGGTRGIGCGMAEAALARGCHVTICGRSDASTVTAVQNLSAAYDADRVHGIACDVANYEQVERLWASAVERFGRVDHWVNNAGLSHPIPHLWEQQPQRIRAQVDTNLTGMFFGCRVAIAGMMKQDGGGTVYTMEGFGSDGRTVENLTVYGSTKYGLRYATKTMSQEVEGTPVRVVALSPGMVVTDMLMDGYEPGSEREARAHRIFNILADTVETVSPWLVDRILDNPSNGDRIAWLTGPKIAFRFATSFLNRRDLFSGPGSGSAEGVTGHGS